MTLTDAQAQILRAMRVGAKLEWVDLARYPVLITGRVVGGHLTEEQVDPSAVLKLTDLLLIHFRHDRATRTRYYSLTTLAAALTPAGAEALAQWEAGR